MDLMQLIRILMDVFKQDSPDFSDSEAVRDWIRTIIEVIAVLPNITKLDNAILTDLTAILDNDKTWSLVHGLLIKLVVRLAILTKYIT